MEKKIKRSDLGQTFPESYQIIFAGGMVGDISQGDQIFCKPFVSMITDIVRELLSEAYPKVDFLVVDDIDGESGLYRCEIK